MEEKTKIEKKKIISETHSFEHSGTHSKNNLIAVVRISGMVKVREKISQALHRLRLRRKYSCVLINSKNNSAKGVLEKVKHYVAYGVLDKKTLVELIKARGISLDKNKIDAEQKAAPFSSASPNPRKSKGFDDAEKIASELESGKSLEELGLKPFFRLHPPRKGIKSKLAYPKGVLGNNKEDINKLIERML